jgi:hypothetical protein
MTKADCSTSHSEVLDLQAKHGIDYAAAVGSLIYLINTFVKLQYGDSFFVGAVRTARESRLPTYWGTVQILHAPLRC